jgi:hypothetical protein
METRLAQRLRSTRRRHVRPRRRVPWMPLAAAMVAVVASGCWPQPGAGPGHTRYNGAETALNSQNVAGLREAWSVPTVARPYEPVTDGRRVVVSEDRYPNDGTVHVEAFAPDTGSRLWDHVLVDNAVRPHVSPVAFSGSDALVTGYGFVGGVSPPPTTCPTALERLDPATGDRLAIEPGRRPVGPAVTSGDSVAVVTVPIGADCIPGSSQRFEVRDRQTLASRYTYAQPVTGTVPTFAGDLVIITSGPQMLAFPAAGCGAATCSPTWAVTLPDSPPIQTTSFATPVASDGLLFVKTVTITAGQPPTTSIDLRVFDAATGADLGRTPLEVGARTLAVRGSTVYYAQEPSFATNVVNFRAISYCRDCPERFTQLWTAPIDGTNFTADATIGGDVVYVAVNNGTGVVVALDADGCGAAACSPLATVPTTGFALDLSVARGRVFAATTLGNGDDFALAALALP